jgi:hypothetical protein
MFRSLLQIAGLSHRCSAPRSSTRVKAAPRLESLEGRELLSTGLPHLHMSHLMGANIGNIKVIPFHERFHGLIQTTGNMVHSQSRQITPFHAVASIGVDFGPTTVLPAPQNAIAGQTYTGPVTPQSKVTFAIQAASATTGSPLGTAQNPIAGQPYTGPVTPQSKVTFGLSPAMSASGSGEVMVNRGIQSYPSGPVTPGMHITF